LSITNALAQKDAEIISTFIYSKLGSDVLEHFPNLKLIVTRSTGYDHIDLDYCNKHGITVCNVPSYGENTVAEHVFALLLAISHHLIQAVDRTRKGDFTSKGLRGFDLRGKTLGVIGTGSIGRHVIKIAKGFDINVVASDLEPDMEYAERVGFEYLSMKDLLAQSDIITLHVPGNQATHHMLSSEEFAAIKDGAVLINTSRGTVVDVHALLHSLADGKLSAAGLDVLPDEPVIREEAELLRAVFSKQHDLSTLLADHVLLHMQNVIITPHNAFNTREAVQRILKTTRDNIAAFTRGNPQNAVTGRH
jgi:D-lactate dehydrogenase